MRYIAIVAALLFCTAEASAQEMPDGISPYALILPACSSDKDMRRLIENLHKDGAKALRTIGNLGPKGSTCATTLIARQVKRFAVVKKYEPVVSDGELIESWIVKIQYRKGRPLYFLFARAIGRSA